MIVETNAVNKIQLCRNRPYIFLCEESYVCVSRAAPVFEGCFTR